MVCINSVSNQNTTKLKVMEEINQLVQKGLLNGLRRLQHQGFCPDQVSYRMLMNLPEWEVREWMKAGRWMQILKFQCVNNRRPFHDHELTVLKVVTR